MHLVLCTTFAVYLGAILSYFFASKYHQLRFLKDPSFFFFTNMNFLEDCQICNQDSVISFQFYKFCRSFISNTGFPVQAYRRDDKISCTSVPFHHRRSITFCFISVLNYLKIPYDDMTLFLFFCNGLSSEICKLIALVLMIYSCCFIACLY